MDLLAEPHLITELSLLDMEPTIGLSETPGDHHGEKMDMLDWQELEMELDNVDSNYNLLTLLLD